MIPSEDRKTNPDGYIYSFPKVCFCDLPLSRIAKHMKTYKKYGIGLTKEWGKRKGLNPVLYVHKDSIAATGIFQTNNALARESKKIDDQGHETFNQWEDAMRQYSLAWEGSTTINYFVKPYEGAFIHGGETHPQMRFYDEREWRFVPPCDEPGKVFMVFKWAYDQMSQEQRDDLATDLPPLEFEPDDIRYIIVEKDEEVLPMYHDVLTIKSESKKYSSPQLELLTTRIISSERIQEDF